MSKITLKEYRELLESRIANLARTAGEMAEESEIYEEDLASLSGEIFGYNQVLRDLKERDYVPKHERTEL